MRNKPWLSRVAGMALGALTLTLVACSSSGTTTPGGAAQPQKESGVTEGGEGKRFVGVNVYDTLLLGNNNQGDSVPVPGPGLATEWMNRGAPRSISGPQLSRGFSPRPIALLADSIIK